VVDAATTFGGALPLLLSPLKVSLVLGLSFFFGLAFERFYATSERRSRPGGIRTFPLIALAGAFLYALEPHYLTAYCIGFVVLGVWLYPYYAAEVAREETAPSAHEMPDGLMVPTCNLVAYVLGPVGVAMEPWLAFVLAVAAVLLLQARDRLHQLAQTLPGPEIITLGQFLILTGIVLPLVPNEPVTPLTPITPFQVWLAVVVVSSLSYGSYVLQKLLSGQRSLVATSVLGGMYSSTATTVVLAKRLRDSAAAANRYRAGIVLATALMYLRLLIVVAIFNTRIARELVVSLPVLGLFGTALAGLCWRFTGRHDPAADTGAAPPPTNPLELPAALVFALLFVITSAVSAWVIDAFGDVGVYWLASIVGVSDIDPFVLSIAQGAASAMTPHTAATAILIAASSNNVLKAIYSVAFGGWRNSAPVVAALIVLSSAGVAASVWMMQHH
jgi:uncharacterized membrane protein (DUF4010 family)